MRQYESRKRAAELLDARRQSPLVNRPTFRTAYKVHGEKFRGTKIASCVVASFACARGAA